MVELLCERFQVVGAVATGEELVRSANCLFPDVIVSDVFMTGMDGLSARSELIARHPAIPCVFVSATLGKEIVQLVPGNALVAFVYKVEMLDHLITAVSAVLAGERYFSPYYRV